MTELSETGQEIKRKVAAVAEMERKIFEFLEQQHPNFLSSEVIRLAVKSVHLKTYSRFLEE